MISPYRGQHAALATRHGKERVIAPAFTEIGVIVDLAAAVDTDALGTFTGEIPRHGGLRQALMRKAELACEAAGLPLSLASEGSFGPHPAIPFLAAGREAMVFRDAERGIAIIEELVSERTNYATLDLTPGADLEGFLARAGFPSHALVVRCADGLFKGVAGRDRLDQLLRQGGGPVRLETDMRAHMNPTRMAEIARLAARLAMRVATPCPACGTPGFGSVRSAPGLPCAECGTPTALVRQVFHGCAVCGFEVAHPRADGRMEASPAECPTCNP